MMGFDEFSKKARAAFIEAESKGLDDKLPKIFSKAEEAVYNKLMGLKQGILHKEIIYNPGTKGREYLWMFLWESVTAMRASCQTRPDEVAAFHVVNPLAIPDKPGCFGILHFVSHNWNYNVVAHNVGHYVFHLTRLRRSWVSILDPDNSANNNTEEYFCQCMGQMGDQIFNTLYDLDQKFSAPPESEATSTDDEPSIN